MSGLKEIRTRIGSIRTTRQVTSAMKMVSAAKLKKAQDAVISFRPYALKFKELFFSAAAGAGTLEENPYTARRDQGRVMVVLISANRGLCGAFNSAVIHAAMDLIEEKYLSEAHDDLVDFMAIGKQGEKFLLSHKIRVSGSHNHLFDLLDYDHCAAFCDEVITGFLTAKYKTIELVYNDFVNAAQYTQVRETFLPLQFPGPGKEALTGDTIYEPSAEEVVTGMIPMWLRITFHKALLVSWAAEQGARMTAMHQATDNATDLLNDLTLQYNKARQAAITKEILEITGGAEALRK
ncbi:MAG TPA: ATP synthase F1 subunit gamma [Prolixibacteraceae bacterium]|nr:ATP synthase F1 subunit gamma [Prolixibacteraceae bacterium]